MQREVISQLLSAEEENLLLEIHFMFWVKALLYIFYIEIDWYLIKLHFMPQSIFN